MVSKKLVKQDKRFADTMYVVEGDSFFLWKENQYESNPDVAMTWEQDSRGFTLEIGSFHRKPIRLCFFWYLLDGHRVVFWECVSMVSHYGMIREWFRRNLAPETLSKRCAHVDVNNFGHVIQEVKELGMKPGYVPHPNADKSIYASRRPHLVCLKNPPAKEKA